MAEPREVTVKRYRCAFCPRGFSRRPRAVEHMTGCRLNPDQTARIAKENAEYEAALREDGYEYGEF